MNIRNARYWVLVALTITAVVVSVQLFIILVRLVP